MNLKYMNVAEEKIPNIPMLVNLISYRTRQLNAGARPMVKPDRPDQDHHDIVLKEIAEGVLTAEMAFSSALPDASSSLDFDASILL